MKNEKNSSDMLLSFVKTQGSKELDDREKTSIESLLEKANIRKVDDLGQNSLILAIQNYNMGIVRLLMGTNDARLIIDAPDSYGQTPLMTVAASSDDNINELKLAQAEIAKLLIRAGANTSAVDEDFNQTALGIAIANNKTELINEMIKNTLFLQREGGNDWRKMKEEIFSKSKEIKEHLSSETSKFLSIFLEECCQKSDLNLFQANLFSETEAASITELKDSIEARFLYLERANSSPRQNSARTAADIAILYLMNNSDKLARLTEGLVKIIESKTKLSENLSDNPRLSDEQNFAVTESIFELYEAEKKRVSETKIIKKPTSSVEKIYSSKSISPILTNKKNLGPDYIYLKYGRLSKI